MKNDSFDLSEHFHIATSLGQENSPYSDSTHIKDFFAVKDIRHKTRLKRKDVFLISMLLTEYEYYKHRYGLDISIITDICDEVRHHLVSEGGKSRAEFVETVENKPEYPILSEQQNMLNPAQGNSSFRDKLFKR